MNNQTFDNGDTSFLSKGETRSGRVLPELLHLRQLYLLHRPFVTPSTRPQGWMQDGEGKRKKAGASVFAQAR